MRKLPFVIAALSLAASAVAAPRFLLIKGVPHVKQKPDFCGEACAAMWLNKLGHKGDQDWVYDQAGVDPRVARGAYTPELARALQAIGFDIGPVLYKVRAGRAAAELNALWLKLRGDLAKGVPSIVCMSYDDKPRATEHFRLVLGHDPATDEVIYHEPAVPGGAYRRMKRSKFLSLWPLKYSAKVWTVIRFRLKPGRLKPFRKPDTFTAADYCQHIMKLKKKIPAKGFHIIVQPPFVVIGDESLRMVRVRAESTVKWSVDRLKALYFRKNPAEILDIWLFKDKASYRKHTRLIFNDNPHTPFGYYSPAHKALVMNISTGGGTLVHEIVHPFVAANFPECPAWFNEGLASLYEQCGLRSGRIWGFTNWRLAGLQRAIRRGRVPSFKTLCSTTTRQFYNEDPGTNYGQARYLCYYLQSKGLLVKYFHAFRRNAAKDPTGYKTLMKVLGVKDMPAFKKRWEKWTLKLAFP